MPTRHDAQVGLLFLEEPGDPDDCREGGALGGKADQVRIVPEDHPCRLPVQLLSHAEASLPQGQHQVADDRTVPRLTQHRGEADESQGGEIVEGLEMKGGEDQGNVHGPLPPRRSRLERKTGRLFLPE